MISAHLNLGKLCGALFSQGLTKMHRYLLYWWMTNQNKQGESILVGWLWESLKAPQYRSTESKFVTQKISTSFALAGAGWYSANTHNSLVPAVLWWNFSNTCVFPLKSTHQTAATAVLMDGANMSFLVLKRIIKKHPSITHCGYWV